VTTSQNSGICKQTAADVNAMNGASITAVGNVDVPLGYFGPDAFAPTAAGFRLDASCALQGLAITSPLVPLDFDGEARFEPEIGPDECPQVVENRSRRLTAFGPAGSSADARLDFWSARGDHLRRIRLRRLRDKRHLSAQLRRRHRGREQRLDRQRHGSVRVRSLR
jgi:hypothetical protein